MRRSRVGAGGSALAADAAPRTLCCIGATGAAIVTGALAGSPEEKLYTDFLVPKDWV